MKKIALALSLFASVAVAAERGDVLDVTRVSADLVTVRLYVAPLTTRLIEVRPGVCSGFHPTGRYERKDKAITPASAADAWKAGASSLAKWLSEKGCL